MPHILKAFYDEDILEEEAILEWADKVNLSHTHTHSVSLSVSLSLSLFIYSFVHLSLQASTKHVRENIAKQIHEKAAPIVAWLRTAEEESEEEDEDEVEVVYSESAGSKGITTITEKPPQPAEEVDRIQVFLS